MPKEETSALLLQTGEVLPASETGKIFDFPVEFVGFTPQLVVVALNDAADVQALIPNYLYRPDEYKAQMAICVLDGGKPVFAFVKGETYSTRWDNHKHTDVTESLPTFSLANLNEEQTGVILSSAKFQSLRNSGAYWPGYSLYKHKESLLREWEMICVNKNEDGIVTIKFEETVYGA